MTAVKLGGGELKLGGDWGKRGSALGSEYEKGRELHCVGRLKMFNKLAVKLDR